MVSPIWRLIVCGISHKTSSIEEREPLGYNHDDLAAVNAAFNDLPEIIESCVISTCNRTEYYFVTEQSVVPMDIITSFYHHSKLLDITPLRDKFYMKRDRHAADHLFRVAGGLDSMVLGENQILKQVKEGYSSACAVKAAGKVIHRLFHQAFRVGKQIRSDTEMGKGACSVSSASMELLNEKVNGLQDPTILFVGINQMISLAASSLSRTHQGHFMFANRTREKAEEFAARYGADGFGLDELPSLLTKADIVVTCTGSPTPVITSSMINSALQQQTDKKLLIMDMAMPRDVENDSISSQSVALYNLEDVQRHVREHQRKREAAVPQAEIIVERRLGEFMYWFDHVRHELLSDNIIESFDNLRQQELSGIMSKLSPELQEELNNATSNLVEKLLRVTTRTCSKCKRAE